MRKPGGYATWTGPEGLTERDTFTCNHCNGVVFVKPNCPVTEAPDMCRMCMRMVCARCADAQARGGGCVPFERQCEQIEARDRFHRQSVLGQTTG